MCVASPACSSSTKSSKPAESTIDTSCYVLPGSTMAFAPGSGAAYDGDPFFCQFRAGPKGALLTFTSTAPGAPGNRSALWVYVQTSAPQGAYSFLASTLATNFELEGLDVAEAQLEQLALPAGSVMASMDAPIAVRYDSLTTAAAGTAKVSLTLPASNDWPTALGSIGGAAFVFEAVPMTGRTSPTSTATLSAKLNVQLGVNTFHSECLAPIVPGGIGCVDSDQTCDAHGGCTGKCAGTICASSLTALTGVCCLPNGAVCGSPGTGPECCGGVCLNEGVCGDDPTSIGLCGGVNSSGSTGGSSTGGNGGSTSGGSCVPNGGTCNEANDNCCNGACGLNTANVCN